MFGDLVTENNSIYQAVLVRVDLVILCTDNNRDLLGKADGSFHKCLPENLPLCHLCPLFGKRKISILKRPIKKHFLKCLVLEGAIKGWIV